MFAKILSNSLPHRGGETKICRGVYLEQGFPTMPWNRGAESGHRTVGWMERSCCLCWVGEEPGKGVLGVSSAPEGILTLALLLHTQLLFVLRS